MTITKQNKGKDSFGRYARAIQNDIAALAREMREGFRSMRGEMLKLATREELNEVRNDVRMMTEVMVSKTDLSQIISEEFENRLETHKLA